MLLHLRRVTNQQQTGKEGNSDLPEVSYNIFDRWQYYFCQLLNTLDLTVGQTEIHTAKPLEPDNCSCEDDTATAN
jgi:hypothetical protein